MYHFTCILFFYAIQMSNQSVSFVHISSFRLLGYHQYILCTNILILFHLQILTPKIYQANLQQKNIFLGTDSESWCPGLWCWEYHGPVEGSPGVSYPEHKTQLLMLPRHKQPFIYVM